MALLLKVDNTRQEVRPENGLTFGLHELYKLLACETVSSFLVVLGGRQHVVWADDDAHNRTPMPEVNAEATNLYHQAGGSYHWAIRGDVLVCEMSEVN